MGETTKMLIGWYVCSVNAFLPTASEEVYLI